METPSPLKGIYTALVIGSATFFIQIGSSSRTSSNGVLTSCSYIDYFALIAGAALLLYGFNRVAKSKGEDKAVWLSVAVIALGAIHIARGVGLIMGPCS